MKDKSTDKHPEYARFDETTAAFRNCLTKGPKKKERRGKQVKQLILGCVKV
jgi:hypothetical protein